MKNNFAGTTTITTEEYLGMRSDIEHLMSVIDSYKDDDKVIVIDLEYEGLCARQKYRTRSKEGVMTALSEKIASLRTDVDKKNKEISSLEKTVISISQKLKEIEDKKLKNRIKKFLAE